MSLDQKDYYSVVCERFEEQHDYHAEMRSRAMFRSRLNQLLFLGALLAISIGAVKGNGPALETGGGTVGLSMAIESQALYQKRRAGINAAALALQQQDISITVGQPVPRWAHDEIETAPSLTLQAAERLLITRQTGQTNRFD